MRERAVALSDSCSVSNPEALDRLRRTWYIGKIRSSTSLSSLYHQFVERKSQYVETWYFSVWMK